MGQSRDHLRGNAGDAKCLDSRHDAWPYTMLEDRPHRWPTADRGYQPPIRKRYFKMTDLRNRIRLVPPSFPVTALGQALGQALFQ